MNPLLLSLLLCQLPIAEDAQPEITVCTVETIEVNTYTDYSGKAATQLVFWEQPRIDQRGKPWRVFKGAVQFDGEGLTAEDGEFVYRGHDVEMRGQMLLYTGGYDAEREMWQFGPVLKFPVCFRWWR